MDALDEVRKEIWRDANEEMKKFKEKHVPHRGRPGKDDTRASIVAEAKAKAEQIKKSGFALGKTRTPDKQPTAAARNDRNRKPKAVSCIPA